MDVGKHEVTRPRCHVSHGNICNMKKVIDQMFKTAWSGAIVPKNVDQTSQRYGSTHSEGEVTNLFLWLYY